MEKKVNKCESCGKQTEDYLNEYGWININNYEFAIQKERNQEGTAQSILWTRNIRTEEEGMHFDFCCIECFLKWIISNMTKVVRDKSKAFDKYPIDEKFEKKIQKMIAAGRNFDKSNDI